MASPAIKQDVIAGLKKEILSLQGYKHAGNSERRVSLGPIDNAFPNQTFPIGAVHELISQSATDVAATNGFISAILGQLMQRGGAVLWISNRRKVYPPALKAFGIAPEQIIFVDLWRNKEVLWATEEALKCGVLSAVVTELKELSFTESRRLQLAVEQSSVTCFVHRQETRNENAVACVSRWKIKPLPSELTGGLPGVGLPKWHVQLLKIRSGVPGVWHIEWSGGQFKELMPIQPVVAKEWAKVQTG